MKQTSQMKLVVHLSAKSRVTKGFFGQIALDHIACDF